jgi:adenosylcobyric acid synthase
MQNAKTIMVQGTASHAGKSLITAALCRIFARAGYRVCPFKSQNMALNSFVTLESGEIGRAQAFQAFAAGIEPSIDMNPILLKPNSDTGAQVVVLGQPIGNKNVGEYHDYQAEALKIALGALDRLRKMYDIVVIEGAGSPAEINLRDHDIANMPIAIAAQAPVLLVADIERGGVFASIVGTMELLLPEERRHVRGYIINKFRGDEALLASGLSFLRERTGVPVLGVLPYIHNLRIEEEDTLGLEGRNDSRKADLRIDIIKLPHLSNFTDFLPLESEPGVRVRYIDRSDRLADSEVIIVPGTKSTIADLAWMRQTKIADAISGAAGRGAWIIGICGGYQILGNRLTDHEHVESSVESSNGLGLLPVDTRFETKKMLTRVRAASMLPWAIGSEVDGYEIHQGRSEPATRSSTAITPAFRIMGEAQSYDDGACCGRVFGSYLHGLFDSDGFRTTLLNRIREDFGQSRQEGMRYELLGELDRFVDTVVENVDMGQVWQILGREPQTHNDSMSSNNCV